MRSCDVQDVTVRFPTPKGESGIIWTTFVRGPDHLPRDVVDFALRKWKCHTREEVYLADFDGNVLYPADQVYTGDEAREVLRKFHRASSLFLYLRTKGVTP